MRRRTPFLVAVLLASLVSGSPVMGGLYDAGSLSTTGSPSQFSRHSAIYDPVDDRLVVFGGIEALTCLPNSNLAALDLNTSTWSEIVASGTPPAARAGHRAVYDSQLHRMIVYGGETPSGDYSDVWALTLDGSPAWSEIVPSGPGPGARRGAALVYDPLRNRLILHGGSDGADQADTWALSLAPVPIWTQLSTAGPTPAPRRLHAAAYDAALDRLVIAGGEDRSFADTHALDLATLEWSGLDPAGSDPIPLPSNGASTWDPSGKRLLYWASGLYFPGDPREVAVLDLGGAPQVYTEPLSGTAPYTGDGGWSLTWDPARGHALLHGGSEFHHGCGISGSTYTLTRTEADRFELSAPGAMEWNGGSSQEIAYAVHNFTHDPLTLEWTLETDPSGFAMPASGTTTVPASATTPIVVSLGFAATPPRSSWLTFRAHPSGEPSAENACTHRFLRVYPTAVGPQPTIRLVSQAYPNPSRSAVAWTVELPSPGRVSLTIVDVAGRVVWSSPATAGATGTRTLVWPGVTRSGTRAAPGLYLARISTGGQTVVRRFVTIF